MSAPNQNSLLQISRKPSRGDYSNETIYAILDEALDVTVSYIADGLARAIPTGFARLDDMLYIHGSIKSHFIQQICQNKKVCLTASLLDGLVLANTAFHHSFNYRSVVAFAAPVIVNEADKKMEVLKAFTDKLLPGRWEDNIKLPSAEELMITAVVGFSLAEASAKIRQGEAGNDQHEMQREVWTGCVPLHRTWGHPIKNTDTSGHIKEPAYLKALAHAAAQTPACV